MPLYDYQCTKCGFTFEVSHKISESPRIKCPKCKSIAKKILSVNNNIIFKGDGFYVNDYKKKSQTEKTKIIDKTKEKANTKKTSTK